MELHYEHQGKLYPVRITRDGEAFSIGVGDKSFRVESKETKPGYFALTIDGKVTKCNIATEGNQRHIFINGDVYRFNRVEAGARPADFDKLPSSITSPISGKVTAVGAVDNDIVEAGQVLITIEAMKMEYQIKAPYAGKVEKINFKLGDQVDIGELLVQMEKTE
ncbi:MAG: biotin/lipoyl-binding protein [Candidatus Thermoplasmatota archaeon]|nr:biotin/lipoyl-binding protein [Candidatus Thermoplasmatota archaeon]MBU4072042.1 biotin/lipoyl-binding protein [Candidatus Thermoplasmatota archaeon]MBU4144573.1 biotin/lipoyl-binding protein [Candidatus Thermoplasmatota archaeon]MBU4592122.1 biotin/lipoyl-binding protein [Candidatus Thermoplasmatota archaeon]